MRRLSFTGLHCQPHFYLTSAFYSTQIKSASTPLPKAAHQTNEKDRKTLQNHPSFTDTTTTTTTTTTDSLHYLRHFSNLTKTLLENPRNYKALATLDSLLNETQFLDSATSLFVIDYLSQIKKLGRAKTVLSHLKTKGKVSDYFLYGLILDCVVKDGTIYDVETVWHEIHGSEFPRIDISDFVIYVCKFGELCEIRSICERVLMGGRVLNRQSYAALVGALCRINEVSLAKELVGEMHNRVIGVDDWTYFVLYQCFCRNGELDEADWVLRKLVRRKFGLDVCVYASFVHGLCKSGKYSEADKLFCKLIKRDCGMKRSKSVEDLREGRRAIFQLSCEGVIPEIIAYEMYFRGLCSVGELDRAESLLKKMMKRRAVPEICVYGCFIRALFRAGRNEDAIKFFSVERKKGIVRVNEIARFVIMGLCEVGQVDDALRIFDEVVESGAFIDTVNVYNCALGCFWREGRVVEAESLFERLRIGNLDLPAASAYSIMITGYCNRGDVSKGLCIFEEMLNSKMVIKGEIYEMIIRGLCACGRIQEALMYLNDMIENGHLVSHKTWKDLIQFNIT